MPDKQFKSVAEAMESAEKNLKVVEKEEDSQYFKLAKKHLDDFKDFVNKIAALKNGFEMASQALADGRVPRGDSIGDLYNIMYEHNFDSTFRSWMYGEPGHILSLASGEQDWKDQL